MATHAICTKLTILDFFKCLIYIVMLDVRMLAQTLQRLSQACYPLSNGAKT